MDFPDETRQAEKKKETEIEHNKKPTLGGVHLLRIHEREP